MTELEAKQAFKDWQAKGSPESEIPTEAFNTLSNILFQKLDAKLRDEKPTEGRSGE